MGSAVAVALSGRSSSAIAAPSPRFGLPIGMPGQPAGVGFSIRHGYGCENAEYYPGLTHTGENWYGLHRNAAGAEVRAAGGGDVVFAGYDYPGRVVIVRHAKSLYSMYGHLDPALAVAEGDTIETGHVLGTVLERTDEPARSHLHFEMRSFFLSDTINGEHPSHGFTCGYECPPGPGYWPLVAEHPSELGWRNPAHLIFGRMWGAGRPLSSARLIVPPNPVVTNLAVRPEPSSGDDNDQLGHLELVPGESIPWFGTTTGRERSTARNARGYDVWLQVAPADGPAGWVRALSPSSDSVGLDGEPSGVVFHLLPA